MKVKNLMIPLLQYLKPDTPLKDAVHRLRTAKRSEEKIGVKGLPVTEKDDKVSGTLYEREVFFAITKSMRDENNGGAG